MTDVQIQTREPVKSIKLYLPTLTGNGKRRHVHIKNIQSNKMHIIQHMSFLQKIFKCYTFNCTCNLMTHSFLVTLSDNNYIYFVIK